jgi:peroxiredoxin
MGSCLKKYFYVVFCLLSCLLLFSCNSNDTKVDVPAGIGDLAPAFSLKGIAGSTVNLSAYENKVVLLEFWATWCPPCKASVPELIEIQKRYEAKEFTVIGISVDHAQNLSNHLNEFSRAYHINYPVLIGNDDVARKYNVTSIPVSFLIDKKGKIINSYVGYTDNFVEKISAQIEKII